MLLEKIQPLYWVCCHLPNLEIRGTQCAQSLKPKEVTYRYVCIRMHILCTMNINSDFDKKSYFLSRLFSWLPFRHAQWTPGDADIMYSFSQQKMLKDSELFAVQRDLISLIIITQFTVGADLRHSKESRDPGIHRGGGGGVRVLKKAGL